MLNKTIEYIRFILFALLIIIAFFLYQDWQNEHAIKTKSSENNQVTINQNNYIPEIKQNNIVNNNLNKNIVRTNNNKIITVKTDLFNVNIDTLGGNVTGVQLLNYKKELNSSQPLVLLNNNPETKYIAQSGLLSNVGPDTSKEQAVYTSEKNNYVLDGTNNELKVILNWSKNNINIQKIYTFNKNNYDIDLDYLITNNSNKKWDGNNYYQLTRTNNPPTNKKGFMNFATYFGAAISSPEKKFKKISFDDMKKNNLEQTINGGWAAMIQHYFVTAWVPNQKSTSQYFSKVLANNLYTVGIIGPNINVNPGDSIRTHAKLYAGPAIADQLEKAAPSLKLTIDYGWFWFISGIIFWMMHHIYNVIGNWGWSIVLVTMVIKILFYKLSAKSYRSMSSLKKLQPKIASLKERFGSDKQKFTQATLELYKKEKVNPMSGCLPILIQIPVFIGLYWVLIESVQLRHSPFIFWIHDLSTKDPYYVLPVLMGLSMFLQQRLNPPPPDPIQAKVMMFMPVVFTVLFVNFPAGLMLYWFVNNSLSFLQQWYIMRTLDNSKK
ncbi:membrane protein insertase YidC [Gammaproteobacteria bacterium]|nr:membrane protein insertase YidC [Gammaproteobacteria bacterium]